MSVSVLVPSAGESISEGELGSWIKKSGDFVQADEIIAEIETEKASIEVPAPSSGVITTLVDEGSTIAIGSEIASIDETAVPTKNEKPNNTASELSVKKSVETSNIQNTQVQSKNNISADNEKHLTPAARKIITENNVSLNAVSPSGPAGRVNASDALLAVGGITKNAITTSSASISTKNEAIKLADRATSSKKMSLLRRTLANRLSTAQKMAALLTTFNEVNMAPIMDVRKKYKEDFKKTYDVSLGFMSFFVKAVTQSLENFPIINSYIEDENVISHNYSDIGIAVSTPKGLVVPVIRNAETLNFWEIEKSILNFAIKGKEGKLSVDELSGGTFTITNGGTFGSMLSTPIVNYPQSAILGMHNIVQRPVAENGEVVIRPVMYVALTYDHRLIDGADAVRFLYSIKERLEDPTRLLLQL